MFGSHFQLAGNVMLNQFLHVTRAVFFIAEQQIISDAGSDKYFFDPFYLSQII